MNADASADQEQHAMLLQATTSTTTHHQPLQKQQQPQSTVLDTVVRAAASLNNMLMDNCNICTVYCDKQVQYETTWEAATKLEASGTLANLFERMNHHGVPQPQNDQDQVQLYQEFLFDEQSVIESVSSRAEDE